MRNLDKGLKEGISVKTSVRKLVQSSDSGASGDRGTEPSPGILRAQTPPQTSLVMACRVEGRIMRVRSRRGTRWYNPVL